MDALMSIDLGSTNLKAAIYDPDGRTLAVASRPTEKIRGAGGPPEWVVWDPDQIWTGAAEAAREAVAAWGDAKSIRAVAVTGMGMDGVPVDENGQALYPFISWHDPRTAPQAEWWEKTIGGERTFAIAGFPAWPITGAMRILWMKENRPDIMARAKKWLLIEDYVNHRLCGAMATDYSMASCMLLLDQRSRTWSDELLTASGIERDLLPDLLPSGVPLGTVHARAAEATGLAEGTPVILGGHDHICGTLPVGAYRPGVLLDVIGTWESVLASLPAPVLSPALHRSGICVQAHVVDGLHVSWGGAPAGESLEWFRRELAGGGLSGAAPEWEDLLPCLGGTVPGAGGVLYLPHISAAGCPVNDSKSLGAFVGMSNRTTTADLLRAVIEAINYQFRGILEAMESCHGRVFDRLIVSGGASKNTFWLQNKADVTGRPIEVSDIEEATPLGAAILAGLGVGVYGSVEEAYERVKRPGRIFEPQSEQADQYAEWYPIYCQLYPALKDLNHEIHGRLHGGPER